MNSKALVFAPFYATYVEKASQFENFINEFEKQMEVTSIFFKDIPDEKQQFSYAEGKWTPKDILLHLIDSERIFAYRALRIARNDQTELPGFEENDYAAVAGANLRTLESLLEEYQAVRTATIHLFKYWNEDQLSRVGKASNFLVSVKALAYIILGHEQHHITIIKERYL